MATLISILLNAPKNTSEMRRLGGKIKHNYIFFMDDSNVDIVTNWRKLKVHYAVLVKILMKKTTIFTDFITK